MPGLPGGGGARVPARTRVRRHAGRGPRQSRGAPAGGRHLASAALYPAHTATTVRGRGDRIAVAGGPFAESREQPGGFALIEARDLNEAIRLAATMPAARLGCVEVRPLAQFAER